MRKVRPCETAFCDEKERHLFKFPKNATVHQKWTNFVSQKRANFTPDSNSRLCYKHFDDSAFSNLGLYKQGAMKVKCEYEYHYQVSVLV